MNIDEILLKIEDKKIIEMYRNQLSISRITEELSNELKGYLKDTTDLPLLKYRCDGYICGVVAQYIRNINNIPLGDQLDEYDIEKIVD